MTSASSRFCRPAHAGFDSRDAHARHPNSSAPIDKLFSYRRKDLVKSSLAIATTFFFTFDAAINWFSFFS